MTNDFCSATSGSITCSGMARPFYMCTIGGHVCAIFAFTEVYNRKTVEKTSEQNGVRYYYYLANEKPQFVLF